MARDFSDLRTKINAAIIAGKIAAAEQPNDGGSANLDHVVLYLPGVREATLNKAGINGYKGRGGTFHLDAPFDGQGQRRYAGVQAMQKHLQSEGVECYVHYQVD